MGSSLLLAAIGLFFAPNLSLSLSFNGQDNSNLLFADISPQESNPKFMNVKQTTEAPNDIIAPSQTQSMVDASFNQGQEARKLRLYILGALMEQLIAWLFQDILPNDVMQRHKRAANGQDNVYWIDATATMLGAILDREECRKVVVCTTCATIKSIAPSSTVAVVVADALVPTSIKQWDKYEVAKRVFISNDGKRCEETYQCKLGIIDMASGPPKN